jgi:hypothetical protein
MVCQCQNYVRNVFIDIIDFIIDIENNILTV